LPVWRLSIKAWLEGRVALARGDVEKANRQALEAERLIDVGSNPDVLGPTWVLRARIALATGEHDEARACFERAIQTVQARSSFANKLSVLKEAGTFLAASSASHTAAQGQQVLDAVRAAGMQHHFDAEREQVLEQLALSKDEKHGPA
jgi:uncharacterized membrane-anchored protein